MNEPETLIDAVRYYADGWQQVQRCPVCRRGATINLQTPHCPRGCWLHGDSMSKTKALLAKLVQVPKKEVDRRVKRKKPKRKGK